MYKLWHKLFGWDYIHWENSADSGIARVHKNDDGVVWYWRYKSTRCIAVIPKVFYGIVWLTCSASKYLKEGEK